MKRANLLLILLLAACGGEGDERAGGESRKSDERAGREPREPVVQIAELTGLYEGQGEGEQRARMCMTSHPSGIAAFGIVTFSPGRGACSGAGEAVRQGEVLQLTMTGDEQCAIEARMSGTQVTIPGTLPQGCTYYCSPGATLAGERFEKTGGTAETAMRAVDLAGDPLCG